MIELFNVCKQYENLKALDNISLKIDDGKIFGLIGKSGAGKSTLLRTINRLEEIDSGKIVVNGVDVSSLDNKGLRIFRKSVGMIFQHFALLETQTVYENIALPLKCNHYNRHELDQRIKELAGMVGIEDKLNEKPSKLSGGQKQRVAIARSLALNPSILLCDEATSALDPITTKQILNLLLEINKKLHITIVVVTHQMEVVKEICEEVAILHNGQLLEVGQTENIFLENNKALRTLIEDDEYYLSYGTNIKIFFPSHLSSSTIITQMARSLDLDFSIIYGKLEKFQGKVLGSLIINVDNQNVQKVKDYLDEKEVHWEVINNDSKYDI